jgi:hypothetical protein
MQNIIYQRSGVRVVATGALRVVLPSGQMLPDSYSIGEVDTAVAFADELAATLDINKAA